MRAVRPDGPVAVAMMQRMMNEANHEVLRVLEAAAQLQVRAENRPWRGGVNALTSTVKSGQA